jgi:hypothetical protein
MNSDVRRLISWWEVIGSKEHEIFTKFFMFYMCLDAWMTAESGEDHDKKKLDWLINEDNVLKTHWSGILNGEQFHSWLNGLKKIGIVNDMRPKNPGPPKELTDVYDFEQVIRFIYQIRCNLFHGSKSPVDSNDRALVRCSAKILEKWIQWTLAKTN